MALTYEPIATNTLSTQGQITFSSIPSTYTDLVLVVKGNNTTASPVPSIQINGLTTAIYNTFTGAAAGTTLSMFSSLGATTLTVNNAGISGTGLVIYNFLNYTNTSYYKTGQAEGSMFGSTTSGAMIASSFTIETTAAINSILIAGAAMTNLVAGSIATLFGVKAA